MIQPPPTPAKPPSKRRAARPWLSANPETRAVQIGVVATIAVHVLLLSFAPKIERFLESRDSYRVSPDEWSSREFQIELAPAPDSQPPPKVKLPEFVEANPNAPDNVPDETNLVAAQNQQVAQETPTPAGKSDKPALKGDPVAASTAIVSGMQAEPTPPAPRPQPAEEQTPEKPAQEAPRKQRIPLPGSEKFEGDNPGGFGGNVAKSEPGATPAPERVEGAPEGSGTGVGLYYSATIDPKKPKPRRTLAPDVVRARPTPLANREFGTENIGAVAYNAKWSAYGEYLQKFIESVDIQWQRIIGQSDIYPVAGTKVVVKFLMNSKGDIPEIISVESSGGQVEKAACTSAIVARSPYGEWPEDMVGVLGTSQELTFTFHYN